MSLTHTSGASHFHPLPVSLDSLSTRTLQHGRFMVDRFLYGKKGGHQILSYVKVIFWSLWFLYHFWTWLVTRQGTEVLFTRTPYRLNTLEWLSSHSCGVFSLGLMPCMVPCCTHALITLPSLFRSHLATLFTPLTGPQSNSGLSYVLGYLLISRLHSESQSSCTGRRFPPYLGLQKESHV